MNPNIKCALAWLTLIAAYMAYDTVQFIG